MEATGENLTDHYRQLVIAGRWDQAYRMMRSTCPELSADDILSILEGRKSLSGKASGRHALQVVTDEDNIHRLEVAELYAGYINRNGAWYRPYGIWPHLLPDDEIPAGADGRNEYFLAERDGITVVFRRSHTPPFWIEVHDDPMLALDQYLILRDELPSIVENPFSGLLDEDNIDARDPGHADAPPDGDAQDMVEIPLPADLGGHFHAPAALMNTWALDGTPASHLAPGWMPRNARKTLLDEIVAYGGLSQKDVDDPRLADILVKEMENIRARHLHRPCTVLLGSGIAVGSVVHPKRGDNVPAGSILVVPDSGPEWFEQVIQACQNCRGAVIVEHGGHYSHLVLACMNLNVRIVLVPDARQIFPAGSRVRVGCDSGLVTLI